MNRPRKKQENGSVQIYSVQQPHYKTAKENVVKIL
jgi:hypothetical protein